MVSKFSLKTRQKRLRLLILLVLMAGLLVGCDSMLPQPTPLPTHTQTATETVTATVDWFPATPTPTGTVLPTLTPQPTREDQRVNVGELLVDDTFSDESLWATRQSEAGNIVFGAENLTLAVANPDAYLFSISQHQLSQHFYLEITIETALCQPNDQFGIVFWRVSETDYYRLLFNCAGMHRLEIVQATQRIAISDWESAVQMQPGAPVSHRMGVWVSSGDFVLFINDAFQLETKIAQDRTGQLGVFAQTVSGSAMTVKFSDLQIYRLDLE
jgi:hypothetical protein